MRFHRPTPLAHSVNLADLNVVAFFKKKSAEKLACKQGSLAADSDNHNILRPHNQDSFPFGSAPNLQS